MNYYERHIGDYLKATAHLSLLEHGIYGRLLDVYYTRESAIPAAQVERLIGARSEEERAALAIVLEEFFQVDGDLLRHGRCDREIAKFQDKQRKAAASANARWSKPASHTERSADAMRTHSEGNAPSNQTPDTNLQTPEEPKTKTARKRAAAPQHVSLPDLLAEGVDEQHAKDWLAVRQRKSLPLTLTAWAEMKAEALKARIAVPEAVRVSAANSWAGFKAAWLQQAGQGPPGRQTATDRRIETIHALTGKHHERPDQPTIIDITPRLVS